MPTLERPLCEYGAESSSPIIAVAPPRQNRTTMPPVPSLGSGGKGLLAGPAVALEDSLAAVASKNLLLSLIICLPEEGCLLRVGACVCSFANVCLEVAAMPKRRVDFCAVVEQQHEEVVAVPPAPWADERQRPARELSC